METPLPLEQTDPELAEHFRLMANGDHAVTGFAATDTGFYFKLRDGRKKFKRREIAREEKIGRNDPCSCGSGKKFKKCCGNT